MRSILIMLLMLLLTIPVCAADPALPEGIKRQDDGYRQRTRKVLQDAVGMIRRARDAHVRDLESRRQGLERLGDVSAVAAIQALIDEHTADESDEELIASVLMSGDQGASQPGAFSILPADPKEMRMVRGVLWVGKRRFVPGLVRQEYVIHASQNLSDGGFVSLEQLTDSVDEPALVTTLTGWRYTPDRNATARGFLVIEKPGEYQFTSSSHYDRNALYVGSMDRPVCGYRNGEEASDPITLPSGLVPIVSVGYVAARGNCEVRWRPPGEKEFTPIPDRLLFYGR